jgi:hypothetical protein
MPKDESYIRIDVHEDPKPYYVRSIFLQRIPVFFQGKITTSKLGILTARAGSPDGPIVFLRGVWAMLDDRKMVYVDKILLEC